MAAEKPPLEKRHIIGMFAMALACFVIANDFVAFSVALPMMEKDLHSDVSTMQWVVNAYTLVFGVLIVSGGRLADKLGRRRVFFLGSTVFAVFSVLAGFGTNAWVVLGCRALMGIGGAMMWPATLGMTYALLPAARAGLAGGLIIGSCGFGNSVGPLIGGFLTDTISWRWIFFMNLPVAAFSILIVKKVIPEDRPAKGEEGFDYGGVAVLSIALVALLLALDLGIDHGWTSPLILSLFAACAVGLGVFGALEPRMRDKALVPRDVMRNVPFVAAGMSTLLMSAVFFASMLYLPQLMTKELGYSALKAGAGLLPMMATFGVVSFVAGNLYERLGAKLSVCSGAFFQAAGMFLLSRVPNGMRYVDLVPGMVVLGVGIGLYYSSITTAGITALDASRASLGGAIIYMFQVAGGSVGLGLNTAVVLTASVFAEGVSRAFLVDSLLATGSLLVAFLFVGGRIDRHRAHA